MPDVELANLIVQIAYTSITQIRILDHIENMMSMTLSANIADTAIWYI